MNNLKDEFIKAIMQSLKIDKNPFIFATIDEYIKHIPQNEYKAFMSALFGTQHQYLNGLDRVAKVSYEFEPAITNDNKDRAKELILWCESANKTVFDSATKSGMTFDDEINRTGFVRLINEPHTYEILNAVKPYREAKELIRNINHYENSTKQLQAFIDAIELSEKEPLAIESKTRLRLRK